jgi:predicted PurR-regulated permease PerM
MSVGATVNIEPKPSSWSWSARSFQFGVRNPTPLEDPAGFWRVMAQMATIVMAVIIFGAFLYVARALLVPILAALVVSLTLGPLSARTVKAGWPAWLPAAGIVLLLASMLYLGTAILVEPATDLIARSDEIGNTIKDKFRFMERPLFALRELQTAILGGSGVKVEVSENKMLQGVVTALPDIVLQLVLFFATLFFFVFGRQAFRRYVVNLFGTRDGRLRTLKIANDIEQNLSAYLITVTCINIGVGCVVAGLTFLMGFPAPLLWGALAFLLNYIPYVGPGIMHVTLFIIGLLTFPTLLPALVAPLLFMTFTFFEGHFLVPAIIGRQLLLHPLAVFLSLAFWAWLWGPVGAFLATPILIMAVVMIDHVYPRGRRMLPG